jgi:hypothetical protein
VSLWLSGLLAGANCVAPGSLPLERPTSISSTDTRWWFTPSPVRLMTRACSKGSWLIVSEKRERTRLQIMQPAFGELSLSPITSVGDWYDL